MADDLSPLTIRFSEESDGAFIKKWLSSEEVLRWFPLVEEREIDDAVRIWMSYVSKKSTITALWDGVPCGSAVLNLQFFEKIAHCCLLTILVDEDYRGKGIGTRLMEELIALAIDPFKIEVLYLEVYEDNPAIRLYERLGFVRFGEQKNFTREKERDRSKIFMEKILSAPALKKE